MASSTSVSFGGSRMKGEPDESSSSSVISSDSEGGGPPEAKRRKTEWEYVDKVITRVAKLKPKLALAKQTIKLLSKENERLREESERLREAEVLRQQESASAVGKAAHEEAEQIIAIGNKQSRPPLETSTIPDPSVSYTYSGYSATHVGLRSPFPQTEALVSIVKTEVQSPAVREFQQRIKDMNVAAPEERVRASLMSALKKAESRVPGGAKTHFTNFSETRTVGEHTPDIMCIAAGREGGGDAQALLEQTLAIGQVKSGAATQFSREHVGQLLSVMAEVAQKRPDRGEAGGVIFIIGFACNAANIQFYEAVFECATDGACLWKSWHASPVVSLKERGALMLVHLMTMSASDLGYIHPTLRLSRGAHGGKSLKLARRLGRGATASCYLVSTPGVGNEPGADAVAKVFTLKPEEDAAAFARRELAALRGVAKAAARLGCPTPQAIALVHLRYDDLLSDGAGRPALLVGPYGASAFALPYLDTASASMCQPRGALHPSAFQFCDLVDALLQLHLCGFAHRDPRPENFFLSKDGRFVLGDAGLVAPLDTAYDWRLVSIRYGPLAALQQAAALGSDDEVEAMAAAATADKLLHGVTEDFEQVARLVFAAAYRMPVHAGRYSTPSLVKAWERVERCTVLQALLAAAQAAGKAVQACPVVQAQASAARAVAASSSAVGDEVARAEAAIAAALATAPETSTGGAAAAADDVLHDFTSRFLSDEARRLVKDFKAVILREYPVFAGCT